MNTKYFFVRLIITYVIKSGPLRIRFRRRFVPLVGVHRPLDEVLVHDADESVVLVKTEFGKK